MVSMTETNERRSTRGSASPTKLTNGNHNDSKNKTQGDISDDDDDQMTAMLAHAVKVTRSTEIPLKEQKNGSTHMYGSEENCSRKRPLSPDNQPSNSSITSEVKSKRPRTGKDEEYSRNNDEPNNSQSGDRRLVALSPEKKLSTINSKPAQPKEEDDDIIEATDEETRKRVASEKEKALRKSANLASEFCQKFCDIVAKNEKPVCAAQDLRISDVFCRFVEHQCASSLAATIDVIKSTHVRFPSHISLPPSQVVGMLAQYEPLTSIKALRQELFPNEPQPQLTDSEKRDKLVFKNSHSDRAPYFGFCAYNLGLELVQEKVYRDVIDGKHMNFFSRGPHEYDKVCGQLKPILNNLIIKNKSRKIEERHTCTRCKFHSSILSVVREHARRPHCNRNRHYVCAICDYDSQSKSINGLQEHMLNTHQVILLVNEEVGKDVDDGKYPCPECEDQFVRKSDLIVHLRDHRRYTRKTELQHRQDPRNGITAMQFLWPRAQSEYAIARQSTSTVKPSNEAPLAGMTSMPNGVPAALCVQLGGPDGAFALIKRPIQNMVQSRFGTSFRTTTQGVPVASQQYHQQSRPQLTSIMPKPNQYAATGASHQTRPMLNASLLTKMSNIAAMTARSSGNAQRAPMLSTARGNTLPGRNTQTSHQLASNRYGTTSSPVTDEYAIRQLLSRCSKEQQSILSSKSYNCEICDTHVQGAWRYLRHMQQTHKQLERKVPQDMLSGPSLSCSKCMERFFSYEGLERHLVLVHSLVTGDLLAKAKARQDSGRCRMCSRMYAFNFLSHLVSEHQVKLCSAEIVYSCDVCSFSCNSYRELDSHLQSKHPLAASSQSFGRPMPASKSKPQQPIGTRPIPKPAQKQKKGGLRYTCTPCALKFDKYDQVIRHWQRSHLKKIRIPLCRIDECDEHRESVEKQFDIDWTLPDEPPLKQPTLTSVGDGVKKFDLNETITLE